MEFSSGILDSHDELRKLQDKVKRLELQNKQLRIENSAKNGLVDKTESFECQKPVNKSLAINPNHSIEGGGDLNLSDEMNKYDFCNEERWLYASSIYVDNKMPINLIQWLQEDLKCSNDNELYLMRRDIAEGIEECELVIKKNIDTRTFTRPKKRFVRTPLETMAESPIMENRILMSTPHFARRNMHLLGESIDDVSLAFECSLPSLGSEAEILNSTFIKTNTSVNTSFHSRSLDQHLYTSPMKHNSSQISCENLLLNSTYNISPVSVVQQLEMNTTFQKAPSELNCTFSVANGSGNSCATINHRNIGRTVSGDIMDEDQMSSASDSSFSSVNRRLNNIGDVQIIAHMQEESLKHISSTPKRNVPEDSVPALGDGNLLSPILRTNQEINHDYQSDQSDYSSAGSRAKSSRSSIRSSPGSSPFGSTQILSNLNDCIPYQPSVGLPKRELKLIPPSSRGESQRLEAVDKPVENLRSRVSVGLRQPVINSSRIAKAPVVKAGSGIPRPASRIPAPRPRSTYNSQPPNKANWMDGCY